MTMNSRRRALTAFYISLFLHVILLVLGVATSRQDNRTSWSAKIVNMLGSPGGEFGDWLAPPGHGAAHFVGGFLLAVGFSFVFYAVLAWVIISLPTWWRERT